MPLFILHIKPYKNFGQVSSKTFRNSLSSVIDSIREYISFEKDMRRSYLSFCYQKMSWQEGLSLTWQYRGAMFGQQVRNSSPSFACMISNILLQSSSLSPLRRSAILTYIGHFTCGGKMKKRCLTHFHTVEMNITTYESLLLYRIEGFCSLYHSFERFKFNLERQVVILIFHLRAGTIVQLYFSA